MKPVHVIAVGEFGSEVSEQISRRVEGTLITKVADTSVILPSDRFPVARLHVLASSRPVSWMSKMMDKLAHDWNTPWIPAISDHPYLRIGPVVVPKAGACYHCFEKRLFQHSPITAHMQAMYQHYDRNPAAGPKGYLKSLAGWAGLHIVSLDKRLLTEDSLYGSVWQMNVLTREAFRSKAVGIHGCPRCGLGRAEETRSVEQLSVDLNRILGEPAWQEEAVLS